MFGFDYATGMLIIFYAKVSIADALAFLGALFGLYKNYRQNVLLLEAQLKEHSASNEQRERALKLARTNYIKDHAKALFLEVEQLSKITDMTCDDKLIEYVKKFHAGFDAVFESKPSEEEINHMHTFAAAYSHEDHVLKGLETPEEQKELPFLDPDVDDGDK